MLGLWYSRKTSEECVEPSAAPKKRCKERPKNAPPRGALVDFTKRVEGRLRYFLVAVMTFLAAIVITLTLNTYVPLPIDFQAVFLQMAVIILLGSVAKLI
jgi:hypothetical protein